MARLTEAARRWRVALDRPYPDVHPGDLVYGCALADGTPAVIKTEPDRGPEDEFLTGIDALVLYGGEGMARVLEFDRDERVVLMERISPGEPLWRTPISEALDAIASVMAKLRRPPADGHRFPSVRAYHRAWTDHVQRYGGAGPIDADLFDIGERSFLELCGSQSDTVVLHRDLHYGNVLSSDRQGWLAIDPKGVVGEPCYEVGPLFWNRLDELDAPASPLRAMRWRVEAFAERTGFDRERVRGWALAQAVLSEIWSADDPEKQVQVDMRAARLLHEIGALG